MSINPSRVRRVTALVCLVASLSLVAGGVATAAPRSAPAASTAPATTRAAAGAPLVAHAAPNGSCANVGSKHFAKTRFAIHAALAFGAFHRYIYKPLKNGAFKQGADKRVRTFLKAALSGAFVVHEVKEMVKFAEADKTLCKIVPDIAGAKDALGGLIGKLKGGNATEGDLNGVSDLLDSIKSKAGI